MWEWASSTGGQAAATWLSAGLSLFAIVIALVVALIEQRRAHAERERELRQDREDRARRQIEAANDQRQFIEVCAELIGEACTALEREIESCRGQGYVTWSPIVGVPAAVIPMRQSLSAFLGVRQNDPKVILALSTTVTVLKELIEDQVDGSPSEQRAIGFATRRLDRLRQLRLELLSYAPSKH